MFSDIEADLVSWGHAMSHCSDGWCVYMTFQYRRNPLKRTELKFLESVRPLVLELVFLLLSIMIFFVYHMMMHHNLYELLCREAGLVYSVDTKS